MSVERLARLVAEARTIAVLSGAGVSTPSGIPDFRSATGLYSDERNANVFDIDAFHRDPAGFYRFAREFYGIVQKAAPNAAHAAFARWERIGKDVQIATQNIDDLHQRAGSNWVYPVHGTMATSTCQSCFRSVPTATLEPAVFAGDVPTCGCGGVFKPDVTFFGELLPQKAWDLSVGAMMHADLLIVVGTSLVVYPAASLPNYRPRGAALAIVNRDETALDSAADVVLRGDLAEVFAAVDGLL